MNDELLQAGLALLDQGIGVIPCKGKKPSIAAWARLMKERMSREELIAHWRAGRLQNIGAVCGAVSQLTVIDLDGNKAIEAFAASWPDLYWNTRIITTGSGHGEHVYLRPAIMPRTMRVMGVPALGNIELRAEGCYVIAPPSLHPETRARYQVKQDTAILEVDDLERVRTWLYEYSKAKPRAAVKSPPKAGGLRAIGFAGAALAGEVSAVRNAPVGSRNNRLNLAAYNLGQLVADGLLARELVERELLAAAIAGGQSEMASWRTIQSGLTAGMGNPRSRRGG